MKPAFQNRKIITAILVLFVALAGALLVQLSACEDDPLFAPAPPVYTWKPGTLHADSVSYRDNDSITLYGHYKPKAFVVHVNTFSITLAEQQNGTITRETVYLLEKDKVWNFRPENYADTAVMAKTKIPRPGPKANTRYYFTVNLDIIPPPGYPASAGRLQSTALYINVIEGG